ncbi:MAG: hypothetical protein ACFFC7_03015 [Candidatus Hermodarchaeota archaeon]
MPTLVINIPPECPYVGGETLVYAIAGGEYNEDRILFDMVFSGSLRINIEDSNTTHLNVSIYEQGLKEGLSFGHYLKLEYFSLTRHLLNIHTREDQFGLEAWQWIKVSELRGNNPIRILGFDFEKVGLYSFYFQDIAYQTVNLSSITYEKITESYIERNIIVFGYMEHIGVPVFYRLRLEVYNLTHSKYLINDWFMTLNETNMVFSPPNESSWLLLFLPIAFVGFWVIIYFRKRKNHQIRNSSSL